jgi:lipopolysaccharide export system protein LptA
MNPRPAPAMRLLRPFGLGFLLLSGLSVVLAQSDAIDPSVPFYGAGSPTIEITRNDKVITAIKYGPDEKGLSIICLPADDATERITSTVYADEAPYAVHITIDKNLIKTPVAYVRKKDGGDGELEAYNGTVTENPDPNLCLPIIKADPKPGTVLVEQGKTKLSGSRLDYNDKDGIALVTGPIEFERPQENDFLRGKAKNIKINVDEKLTFLEGDVVLDSKCRTSKAARVEYDDSKNTAILYGEPGKPATSTEKTAQGGTIEGDRLEYNLDTNDIVVESDGKLKAKLDSESSCK